MMALDRQDEGFRDDVRQDVPAQQRFSALRLLEENGVDVTGAESGAELTLMQVAVDAFRRAAEALAGRNTVHITARRRTSASTSCRPAPRTKRRDSTPSA